MPDSKDKTDLVSIVHKTAGDILSSADHAQYQNQININVLIVEATKNASNQDERLEAAREMMKLAKEFEDGRIERIKELKELEIDVKNRDPDEIEKRENNRIRRFLKLGVGLSTLFSGALGFILALFNQDTAATIFLISFGLGLSMSAMLASGESISSNDAVKIIQALRGIGEKKTAKKRKTTPSRKSKSSEDKKDEK